MILTDIHTHSKHSHDGISTLSEMANFAKKQGYSYLGVSEHFDYDYLVLHIVENGQEKPGTTDAESYFAEGRALQAELNDENFQLLLGGEYGFANDKFCFEMYEQLTQTYHPDFVVNSVHSVNGNDAYFGDLYRGASKQKAYSDYLTAVRESLDVPYDYDIVPHVGYASRYAPYLDKKLRYAEFSDLYDDILKTIIAKGKILEVNSSARGAESEFLPDTDVLTRYFELGGRKISFASDAHNTERIGEKRELICSTLRKIGFTHLTVPCRKQEILIEL